MHANADLLQRLYTALDRHEHNTMADCYHPEARFRDIAFDLQGIKKIHSMWHMISETDIRAKFEVVDATDRTGRVKLVDTYTFGAKKDPPRKGRPVRNVIESQFVFEGGRIKDHHDFCDPKEWARQAMGGPLGYLAGRIHFLRWLAATLKLRAFVKKHPEYD